MIMGNYIFLRSWLVHIV